MILECGQMSTVCAICLISNVAAIAPLILPTFHWKWDKLSRPHHWSEILASHDCVNNNGHWCSHRRMFGVWWYFCSGTHTPRTPFPFHGKIGIVIDVYSWTSNTIGRVQCIATLNPWHFVGLFPFAFSISCCFCSRIRLEWPAPEADQSD